MEDALKGIDATLAEGFLDLKVRNDTQNTFQIIIEFDDEFIYGYLCSKEEIKEQYKIINKDLRYIKEKDKIYEKVDIYRQTIQNEQVINEQKLYTNKTQIGYELPKDVEIKEEE